MKKETNQKLKELVKNAILSKIDKYNAETEYKPFFQAIFTKEQILTHTIVHSFYTSFGMSIYEQLVKTILPNQQLSQGPYRSKQNHELIWYLPNLQEG